MARARPGADGPCPPAWEEHLAHPHLPRTLARWLARAGFEATPPTVLPLLNTGNATDTFSGILLGLVATFVVDRQGLDRETVDAWAASMRELEDRLVLQPEPLRLPRHPRPRHLSCESGSIGGR